MDVLTVNDAGDGRSALSARQREVLELVSRGRTSKEIARQLAISPSTVDNHIKAAIDKLGARNRHEAARLLRADKQDGLSPENERDDHISLLIWRVPAMSSRIDDQTRGQKLAHILRIAIFAVIGASAAILTITGVVYLLPD
ncbi:MAG: LuxR C-terminal-related transcriptional regulator [Cypionkella sp.]